MQQPSSEPGPAERSPWRPSVRVIVPLLMVVPALAASFALGWVAIEQSRRAAEELEQRIAGEIAGRVQQRLGSLLALPGRINELNARALADGSLDQDDLGSWLPTLHRQLSAFPGVNSIGCGTADGRAVWLIRYPGETDAELALNERGTGERIVERTVDADGRLAETVSGSYAYDPRVRPWYTSAIERGEPGFSPIFPWVRSDGAGGGGTSTLGLGYSQPVRDADGAVVGVLDTELALDQVSDFLSTLRIAETGRCFIVDRSGLLVATSFGQRTFDDDHERITPAALDPPWNRLAAAVGAGSERIVIDGAAHRVHRADVDTTFGLGWTTWIVIPEAELLGGVVAARRRAIAVSAVTVAAALLLGIGLAQLVVLPIIRLQKHAARVRQGDLDQPLRLGGARELKALEIDIDRMVHGLQDRERMRSALSLAMEVQQRLLPSDAPTIDGLDVAGHSTYCDETGGDYYDFLEVSRDAPGRLTVALGDVMGHGIAAALLMATARGSLRSRASAGESLAELMGHVNELLVADTGGSRFMTMLLMDIDSNERSLRWCTAGQHAGLLYVADGGAVLDLHGAGLPLGILEEGDYEEHARRGLAPGDVFVVGTDGLWESTDPGGDDYGFARLRDSLKRHAGNTAAGIVRGLLGDLEAHCGARRPEDDVTFVVVKVLR